MTVESFAKEYGYEILCMPAPNKEIMGGYAGDLLSWVMGRLDAGNAWVTIMSNVNIVAVAVLCEPSVIILSEGVDAEDGVVARAEAQGINIIKTKKDTFLACADIRSAL